MDGRIPHWHGSASGSTPSRGIHIVISRSIGRVWSGRRLGRMPLVPVVVGRIDVSRRAPVAVTPASATVIFGFGQVVRLVWRVTCCPRSPTRPMLVRNFIVPGVLARVSESGSSRILASPATMGSISLAASALPLLSSFLLLAPRPLFSGRSHAGYRVPDLLGDHGGAHLDGLEGNLSTENGSHVDVASDEACRGETEMDAVSGSWRR